MTENIFELDGFLEDEEGRKPLCVRVSAPCQVPGETTYYCRVHAPAIFANDKRIFGIDAEQARELAVNFIKSMLAGKKVTDANGR
jgi:hypothetical protein